MVVLWILGILLALILLVLFLRVGVRIAFGDELRVIAVAGPLRLQIVPKPQSCLLYTSPSPRDCS